MLDTRPTVPQIHLKTQNTGYILSSSRWRPKYLLTSTQFYDVIEQMYLGRHVLLENKFWGPQIHLEYLKYIWSTSNTFGVPQIHLEYLKYILSNSSTFWAPQVHFEYLKYIFEYLKYSLSALNTFWVPQIHFECFKYTFNVSNTLSMPQIYL